MWITHLALLAIVAPVSSLAQNTSTNTDPIPENPAPIQGGQTAEVGGNRIGQRQSAAQAAYVEPMTRLNGRIRNRVQARIRNRIDRYYDPKANATSPFIVAGQEVQRQ